jgi:hypothetical protein
MRRSPKSGRWFLAFLASGSNERSRGFSRPSDGLRRLALEPLEDRRLLSMGDLLHTLADPSTLPQDASYFGRVVATDGNLAAVGAPRASLQGSSSSGGAYVFNTNTGALVATLVNPHPANDGAFGSSVAISGNIVVVEGPWGSDAEAAYLFDATTGNLLRTLTDPAGIPDDMFVTSVAISGNTVAVGALGANMGARSAGAVYVFDATTDNLLCTLADPKSVVSDDFGYSVAISGNTVIVGSPYDDTGATDAGTAYLFDATTGNLLHTLANPNPAANDNFGNSVAISGNTIAVGAFQDDSGATDAGAAYVFDVTTGNLLSTLANPSPTASDKFGTSVAVSDNTVVVGTYEQQMGVSNAGAAYLFDAATGNLVRTLANPAPTTYD